MTTDPALFFIDADTLAKPVTRTLLIAGSGPSDLVFTWSVHAEQQANKHLRPGALSVTELRDLLGGRELGPTGTDSDQYPETAPSDRQILADAAASEVFFLVTADVDDFAEIELNRVSISAVNPDLFMSIKFSANAYQRSLRQLVSNMKNPPRTVEEMHALVAKQHPRLFARHTKSCPGVDPAPSRHQEPKVLFRGPRCLRCNTVMSNPRSLELGIGPDCRKLI